MTLGVINFKSKMSVHINRDSIEVLVSNNVTCVSVNVTSADLDANWTSSAEQREWCASQYDKQLLWPETKIYLWKNVYYKNSTDFRSIIGFFTPFYQLNPLLKIYLYFLCIWTKIKWSLGTYIPLGNKIILVMSLNITPTPSSDNWYPKPYLSE